MAARSGILSLGSRLYPGNMQRIFNKDLTRFMQSLSRERQNRAGKRKALLAGWLTEDKGVKFVMIHSKGQIFESLRKQGYTVDPFSQRVCAISYTLSAREKNKLFNVYLS